MKITGDQGTWVNPLGVRRTALGRVGQMIGRQNLVGARGFAMIAAADARGGTPRGNSDGTGRSSTGASVEQQSAVARERNAS